MKKIIFISGLLLILAIGTVFFALINQKNAWLCDNSQWRKNGFTLSPMPGELCEGNRVIGGEKDEYGCLIAAGYSWCPSNQKCQRMWAEYCEEYKDQYKETVLAECITFLPETCPPDCVICPPLDAQSGFTCQNPDVCAGRAVSSEMYSKINDGIDDFEECVAAGNPAQESQPRACQANGEIFAEDAYGENAKKDLIRLLSLHAEDSIGSPLTIEGEARGFWFFEGSFPVILTDWDGRIIAEGIATSTSDWMTEDFIPFSVTLEFVADTSVSDRGSLIFRKDNPSGLPENDDALEITVFFKK